MKDLSFLSELADLRELMGNRNVTIEMDSHGSLTIGSTSFRSEIEIDSYGMRINGRHLDFRKSPEDIHDLPSRVQHSYWTFCKDSARDCEAFRQYADRILSKYGVDLNQQKGLSDSQKLEIRKNAENLGKIIPRLRSDFGIDYFDLVTGETSAVSGRCDYLDKNLTQITEHTLNLAISMQNLGISESLNKLLNLTPTVFSKMCSHENYANNTLQLLIALKELKAEDPFKVALNVINKSPALIEHHSRVELFIKLAQIVNIGCPNFLEKVIESVIAMSQSNFEYFIGHRSHLDHLEILLRHLKSLGYSDPWKSVVGVEESHLQYLYQSKSHVEHTVDLTSKLHQLGCQCPWETLAAIPRDTLSSMFQSDSSYKKALQQATEGYDTVPEEGKTILGNLQASEWVKIFTTPHYFKTLVEFSCKNQEIPSWVWNLKPEHWRLFAENRSEFDELLKSKPLQQLFDPSKVIVFSEFGKESRTMRRPDSDRVVKKQSLNKM